jgi:hypothetical protein
MNLQKLFEQSENKAVAIFVTIAIVAHFVLLWLLDII